MVICNTLSNVILISKFNNDRILCLLAVPSYYSLFLVLILYPILYSVATTSHNKTSHGDKSSSNELSCPVSEIITKHLLIFKNNILSFETKSVHFRLIYDETKPSNTVLNSLFRVVRIKNVSSQVLRLLLTWRLISYPPILKIQKDQRPYSCERKVSRRF